MDTGNIKTENSQINEGKNLALNKIIATAIKIPGVKVNRKNFLSETFKNLPPDQLESVIEKGPVEAKIPEEEIMKKAKILCKKDTLISSSAAFVTGIPGGIAMAATIPTDLAQFYAVTLRLAQELVYLYGENDMWCENTQDPEKSINNLILYCGVMFGVSGADQAVKLMAGALANTALKRLPQKALMKTIYYPIIKSICKFFGIHMNKALFAKTVSKVVPIVGGAVSGGITYVSMSKMGKRLINTLDEAHFSYTEEKFEKDFVTLAKKFENDDYYTDETPITAEENKNNSIASQIKELKELQEKGTITEEEFSTLKQKLINEMK